MSGVSILPLKAEDDFGQECLGMGLAVDDDAATVADMLEALGEFAQQWLADCRGCDGCCKERAPLIAADIPALAATLPPTDFPAHAVIAAYGELTVDRRGAADICFIRDEDGACCLLDKAGKFCRQHPARAFVCRSHFCIPRAEELSRARQEIVNMGENELLRLLLAEEAAGAAPLGKKPLAQLVKAEDYPQNPMSGGASYAQIKLRDILSPALWRAIKKEG